MIQSISLLLLRNAEYIQLQKDFLEIITRNNPEELNILAKFEAHSLKTAEMDALYMKMLANENTQTLVTLDANRDNALNGLSFVITGYTYHYDTQIKNAAQKLANNLALYGAGIARQNYMAETATITSLVNDWETKPDLIEAINFLNLNDWKSQLKQENDNFNTIYINRTQEYGNATPENLKTKREEVNTTYYALRDRINALHTLVETLPSPYTTTINQINALITQYNILLNNRASEPETPTQTITPTE